MSPNATFMDIPAPLKWHGPQEGLDYLPLDAIWPYPWRFHAEHAGGWAGHGIVWEVLPSLWVAFLFTLIWFAARTISKRFLFPPIAQLIGINPKKKRKIEKFSYNMWLLTFYTSSSLFGYFGALRDKDYFALPLDLKAAHALFSYHPQPIPNDLYWYYVYQFGFYFAELYAIFVEIKRSDFMEYVVHHTVTLLLIGMSYSTQQFRIGALVVILHDIPDVFLCAAKVCFYAKWESMSTFAFALFAGSFAYLRLYCLPTLSYALFYIAPQMQAATLIFWIEGFLLAFVLQALHVFWFIMILKLIVRLLLKGNSGDPRSDDEEGEAATGRTKERRKAE